MAFEIIQAIFVVLIFTAWVFIFYLISGVAMQIYCTNARGCYCMDSHTKDGNCVLTSPFFFVRNWYRSIVFKYKARNEFMGDYYSNALADLDVESMIGEWDVLSGPIDDFGVEMAVKECLSYYTD